MTWKPRHTAHAIERVRLLFTFREPLPSKLVARSSAKVTDRSTELGFNAVVPAESSIATIKIQANTAPQQEPVARNGFVMRRHKDNLLAEEVGFRDLVYGYMTTTYGRWESFLNRLEDVLLPALDSISEFTELESIKLEYWDSFTFEADPGQADIASLLNSVDASIPRSVLAGSSPWHSHIGWFEDDRNGLVLINRNLDIVDANDEDGNPKRALGIYTLAEKKASATALNISEARAALDHLHKRSLLLLGNTLTDEYRKKLGIVLEAYQ